jgi:hypothetical protein
VGLVGVHPHAQPRAGRPLAWLLIPVLGLMISAAMLTAIVYALTPDEKWDARHNPGQAVVGTGWGAGTGGHGGAAGGRSLLMGTVAYSGQKFFEWQLQAASATQPTDRRP